MSRMLSVGFLSLERGKEKGSSVHRMKSEVTEKKL